MRGKESVMTGNLPESRITPAYAGKSSVADKTFTPQRDHPRLCGEKITVPMIQNDRSGSPPPMRGKGVSLAYAEAFPGITPAYAGKSPQKPP